ncbi:hypothetical protein [Kitasatospora sp. NPDC059327]|uniref:hypothetical protein n=1 Tax=Kitasatospora sp. NPDC059327 TaxID=3346803 RepID=UPI003694A989
MLATAKRQDNAKSAIQLLSPSQHIVQLVDQVAAMYLDRSGLVIKALLGGVLLQTSSGLRVQGGNVDIGGGLVRNSSTWSAISFRQGCAQLESWQAVTIKKRPDGMVALRGIVSVPAGVTSGVIGVVDDPSLRPKAGEVFPVATPINVNANLFVQSNGNLEIWNATGQLGGWVSFSSVEWSCVD